MKCEIREICGDWALDMEFPDQTITAYFNSRRNAENVKKIIEVDNSVPNAAAVCDMQEIVRCKDCINYIHLDDVNRDMCKYNAVYNDIFKEYHGLCAVEKTHFCSYGERKDEQE